MASEKEKTAKTVKTKMPTNLTAMGLLGNVQDLIGEAMLTQTQKPDISSLLTAPTTVPAPQELSIETPELPAEKKEKALAVKEENRKSRSTNTGSGDYARFLIAPPRGIRKSSVYVSQANHERLMLVMRRLENKISMAEYLENIIDDHFEKYGPELKKLIESVQEEEKGQLKF